ncbi:MULTISPECIES: hypothetical protein [unclassified Mesorhizobium]|uniref:hypothetical protein n=1 Tax=unclassified Mesorhizobium TaxID=325217 RepID=UPI000FD7610C|nr:MULTISPECIES: hypothetical protein [unclassified Mesorhizobium]TGR39574.1 hypothetical protein EN842_40800 [bacterium M00.F.Ca.ET.199.01.1.1]TGU29011.1 hypothetical protein EN799_35975 [bacterium M00.F.Ca.ET.156.01.1.1]TGV84286.1 hypothetical protein EN792_021515 [Mesorhizobium sp. M00.F.Ca.ET.149.01.1.1]TGR22401.1 hypothetical protein EN845_22115 [Mesorhizobium sp. M8A.F.Ca.ET.202.01.1.1]TGR23882.1 hypothetical protein EN840_20760 [Mesorhizobium sp. M8A.F.Ca.ET.197.01.1.1]
MMDLARRRAAAETRILALQQARGVALLDGKSFDNRELTALETELDAIGAAEGEEARRSREAAIAAEKARLAGLREKLTKRNEERLEAAAKAEQAARDFTEQCKLWIAANHDCADTVRKLNQKGGAGIIDKNETELRISQMLACVLKPLTGMGRKLGLVTLPDAVPSRFGGKWAETERTITEPEIILALKGAEQ